MRLLRNLMSWAVVFSAFSSCAPAEPPDAVVPEVRQLTFGPRHHFFGYIGHVRTIPWNESGRYILALGTVFQDRLPEPDEAADVLLIDTRDNYSVRVVDRTRAWNFQQGTMFYWNPAAPETQFFFNDRDPSTNKVFTVLYDISAGDRGGRAREYRFSDTPVGNSGVAQGGRYFAAINYGRLARLRPVTGYPKAADWTEGVKHPADDGVFRVDIESGEKKLIASFRQIRDAIQKARPDVDRMELFINHTLWNRENDRIFFFARGEFDDRDRRINIGFVVNPDGSGLRPLKDHFGGHPEWAPGREMLGRRGPDQAFYDVEKEEFTGTLGTPEIFPNPEGDIALSPDAGWFVNGYPEKDRNFYVFYRSADGWNVRTEPLRRGQWQSGPLRIDPAPCWNRQGTAVVVPALAGDETRQMFLIRLPRKVLAGR